MLPGNTFQAHERFASFYRNAICAQFHAGSLPRRSLLGSGGACQPVPVHRLARSGRRRHRVRVRGLALLHDGRGHRPQRAGVFSAGPVADADPDGSHARQHRGGAGGASRHRNEFRSRTVAGLPAVAHSVQCRPVEQRRGRCAGRADRARVRRPLAAVRRTLPLARPLFPARRFHGHRFSPAGDLADDPAQCGDLAVRQRRPAAPRAWRRRGELLRTPIVTSRPALRRSTLPASPA